MNKIFVLAILGAFSLNASASIASHAVPTANGDLDFNAVNSKLVTASQPTITGNWTFSMIDMVSTGPVAEPQLVKIQAQYINGEVYFTDPTIMEYIGGILPFFATFNEADNTLTFEKAYLQVTWEGYYPFQEPFVYDSTTGKFSYETIVAKYNPTEGVITFDPNCGIAWAKYSEATAENLQGYYYRYMLSGAIQDKSAVGGDNDWRDVGNATLMDGWILPAFDINQNDKNNWFEVPLQQNLGNPNLYRLVDPYHASGFPLLKENLSSQKGYIMIDVTDPENVVINGYKIDAGFLNYDVNCREFYCFNYLGSQVAKFPEYTAQQIVEIMGDDMPFHTTFKDGVVMLSSTVNERGFSNDANFANQDAYYSTGGMAWMGMDGLYINMATMIMFPGADIDDVDTDTPIINDIYYLLDRTNMTATVTGCNPSLTTLAVPASISVKSGNYAVTSIAPNAFQGNVTITSVSLSEGIIEIGSSAFYHCDNVATLKLPEGLTTIGDFAFSFCNLSEINLPSSLGVIGAYAFAECQGVKSINCAAVQVPATDPYAFQDIDTSIPVYVPEASLNAYKSAPEWREFTNFNAIAALNSIGADSKNDGATRFYNLQGIEIKNPANGIFIQVKDNKSEIMKF